MAEKKPKAGNLLISEPFMEDSNFRRSVVLLVDHTMDEGTVGFIINKPLAITMNELVEDFPEIESSVFYGGPVSTNTIHYIHNVGVILDGSTEIAQGVYWGGEFDKLKSLVQHGMILPENIRFFVGYSGWTQGQLDEEMKTGSWILSDMHPNYLFKSKPGKLWNQVLHNKGDVYGVIAEVPEDTSLN